MPRVVVVLDIDAYAKDPRKTAYKGLIEKGELELGGSCPQCGKDFLDVGEVLYGKPVLADGLDWFNSGKSFFDGGVFIYETQTLEWLFENYQLWNREDSIIVCSRECAEIRELRFRQTQAETESKNNNSDDTSFQAESVVIHSETPSSHASLEVPSSPPPVPSSPHTREALELPVSPGPSSPTPSSPAFQQQTPTTFKKGGRAPPPPPPRSPSIVHHDSKTSNTNPFSPSHTGPFSPPVASPSSPATSSTAAPSSPPPSVYFPSFSSSPSPSFENPFSEQPPSPSKLSVKTDNNESKVSTESRPEQSVGWCLDELSKVHSTLNEAVRKIGELMMVLETLRRPESSHPPPPLPPLPEDDSIKRSLSPPLPVFTAPVVMSEADDVN